MIELALRQAKSSRCRHKMGAVLAAGRRIRAASPNLRRNNPAVDFHNATFHAEEAVLRRTGNAAGSSIYVARVNAAGIPMLAKPCPRCQTALLAARIARVYYTVDATTFHGVNLSTASAWRRNQSRTTEEEWKPDRFCKIFRGRDLAAIPSRDSPSALSHDVRFLMI
ncbi:hypothetical protein ACIP98_40815 [Streptomyces sp. NPDC088354]|uniref:hypothetical protein n=1 Tax=Streptomyces sp. NPDC088354 TaxID=3365856 RepID=UPI00380B4687